MGNGERVKIWLTNKVKGALKKGKLKIQLPGPISQAGLEMLMRDLVFILVIYIKSC